MQTFRASFTSLLKEEEGEGKETTMHVKCYHSALPGVATQRILAFSGHLCHHQKIKHMCAFFSVK